METSILNQVQETGGTVRKEYRMIIDSNIITDADFSNHYVVGKAAKATKLLKKGERISIFDGVNTALNYVKEYLPTPGANDSSDNRGEGRFNAFNSFNEAMDTFLNNPTSLVKYERGEMNPTDFHEQGNDIEYDVTGDYIDVGRVLEGVPEHFGQLHNGNPRNRRVRLIVNVGHLHYVNAPDILHRSERIIRLVDMLESAHIRTEIIGVYSSDNSHTEITVKRFDESLVIEDVAVVTHPEFPRRIMFRISEYSDTLSYGYGQSTHLNNGVDYFKSMFNDELTVYIEGNIEGKDIDKKFDQLEKDLEEELSLDVPSKMLMRVSQTDKNLSIDINALLSGFSIGF